MWKNSDFSLSLGMEKKQELDVQAFLSLGYLFLLVLGVIRNAVYYHYFGINYLEYANVLDILLSPIALLTEDIIFPAIIGVISFLLYWLLITQEKRHEKLKTKSWYKKIVNIEKADKRVKQQSTTQGLLMVMAFMIASFFLGTGLGAGNKRSEQMEQQTLKMNQTIEFINGEIDTVNIIGQNTSNIFYVKQDETTLSISPVNGNIQTIGKIEIDSE